VAAESLYRALTAHTRGSNRSFLVEPNGPTVTFDAFHRRCDAVASALVAGGLRPGDRLIVQATKSTDAFAVHVAALRIGAIPSPLNPAYTAAEVERIVTDAEPALYIGDLGPGCPTVRLETLVARSSDGLDAPPDTSAVGGAPTTMLYTSGTTGQPKGAPATAEGLLANGRDLVERWQMSATDVLLHVLPIFHVHGLFVALHTALLAGCRVLFHDHFDASRTVTALAEATVLMAVPTMYHRMLGVDELDHERASGMRLFTSGSAPLPTTTQEAFNRRTGHRIVERYGLTETGILTSNVPGAEVPGAVGTPLTHVELRLSGPDAPHVGEVEARGPSVTTGYWRSPEANRAAFADGGWFRTGDIGERGDDGALRLLGRSKDIVISGGLNIHPLEVERAILEAGCPEVAVIGLPHPDLGEAVVAVAMQPAGVANDLPELAAFKRPRAWIVVDSLPRNAMGKVEKHVLRERFVDWFA
jgi:malonyl-CoA/methylmalonyl-CoA synthetase